MNSIRRDPEILNGIPRFAGTRVPIQNFFDPIKEGSTIDDFLEGFPAVTRDQVLALLHLARSAVIPDPA